MKKKFWQSLNVQITLFTLGLTLVGIWSLSLYAGRMLRLDIQREMGSQQASMANYIGDSIDRELGIRMEALKQVAQTIVQRQLHHRGDTQSLLAQLPVFQSLFSGGTLVVGADASVVAGHGPYNISRDDLARIQAFVKSGEAELVLLSASNSVLLVVPLRGSAHQGAVVGAIRLDAPNFLEIIAHNHYGKAGSYMLYSVAQKHVIIASQRISDTAMSTVQHWLQHKAGTFVEANHLGQETLVTDLRIRRAPWNISVALPTQEAFAPAYEMQNRLRLVALAVSLLTGLALGWVVRRQLSALVATASTLTALSTEHDLPAQLPLTQQHETDQLITAFNRLLGMLRVRNDAFYSSMELSQNTLDSVGVHIAVLDAQGLIISINKPWQQFAQLHADTASVTLRVGAPYQSLFTAGLHGKNAPELDQIHHGIACVLNGTVDKYAVESPLLAQDGTHWFYIRVTPLGTGRQGAVIARTDVTERKRADEQIRKLSQIAQQAPLSVVITDLQGRIEYTNPFFSEKTLFSAQEVLGKNPSILQSGQTKPEVYKDLWQTLVAQRVWRGELHNRKKNGDLFVERAVIAPVCNPDGQVTHYVALKEDVTEERIAENHRLSLSLRVEELSRRLVRTQEETRQRFSQELHDRTSPNLAALRINLDIIADTLRRSSSDRTAGHGQEFTDRIEDTRALIEDTNASIREICAGLHPAAIERGGLLGVIQSYALQFSKRTGIQTRVHCPHDEVSLPPDLELGLFRVLQEALTNCAKHAKATVVDLRMQFDGKPIFLSISDNGQGFDARNVKALRGLGLISMREMVEFAGGKLRVESTPTMGTQVYVEI